MSAVKPVGRFAPTPSGRMHLGNVFSALLAWLSVRSRDGELVLRMEDLDTQRTSEEFARILREDDPPGREPLKGRPLGICEAAAGAGVDIGAVA